MGCVKWPQMTLLGRIILFLTAFGAAMSLQIGIGWCQTNYVLEPLKKSGENTRVLMDATGQYHEPVVAALHEYGIRVTILNPLFIK